MVILCCSIFPISGVSAYFVLQLVWILEYIGVWNAGGPLSWSVSSSSMDVLIYIWWVEASSRFILQTQIKAQNTQREREREREIQSPCLSPCTWWNWWKRACIRLPSSTQARGDDEEEIPWVLLEYKAYVAEWLTVMILGYITVTVLPCEDSDRAQPPY